ncbi:metalloregulator ArsR/SmtB family transcription factor [Pseudarthrobacter sp. efr-133-R2A-89]|uniref:ArsR/SmtB family transcription factor n=1 Tax=Pseudarthrobacter sp. efr-133-R2A-89 TaxID=3040302 RepID=UPI0025578F26|nr:metalloregulator ArsR/SmtB family transcription factor [Pseudarthrobacter sp. efr-133-R2A-89]
MVTDDVFAVIAESTRRDILVALRTGDKAVGELVEELDASQPTISKHLKVLREAQLVSMRAQGQKRYYALNRGPLEGIASWLETFDVGTAAKAASSPTGASPKNASASSAAGSTAAAAKGRPTAAAAAAGPTEAPAAVEPGHAAHIQEDAAAAVLAREGAELSPAVVIPGGTAAPLSDDSVPQQIGRSVGRAATKAADLLANLPKFGRKK